MLSKAVFLSAKKYFINADLQKLALSVSIDWSL